MKCPTCERSPSWRVGIRTSKGDIMQLIPTVECADPCHDVADRASELVDALRPWAVGFGWNGADKQRARALLESLPQAEESP